MSILYFWIATAIIFLIIEMLTSTFYGLSLAIASAIVASMVYTFSDNSFTILQGAVFATASLLFALILPRLLTSSEPDVPQGSDRYIGEKRSVRKISGDMKISLDGVEYLIESEDEIGSGDRVEIIGHKGISMKVKKIEK